MGERLKLNSVSGNVVSFDTDLERNLGSLKIGIEPVQEGSGDPSPDNVRAITGWTGANVTKVGKNLINILDKITAINGVSVICSSENQTITLNGTAIGNGGRNNRLTNFVTLPVGSYALSITTISGTKQGDYMVSDSNNNYVGTHFTLTKKTTVYVGANVAKDKVYNETVKIQLEVGSTDTTYEPYAGTTYPITFPSAAGTVYGGTLDVATGMLTVTHAKTTIDGVTNTITGVFGATNYGCAVYKVLMSGKRSIATICDKFVYSNTSYSAMPLYSFAGSSGAEVTWSFILPSTITSREEANAWFAENPTEFVYELATPQTYSLTPTEISTLLGRNTLYADCGPIQEASYFSRDYVPVASDTGLITITDGIEAPIDSLKIHFEPVQEGSGDPSPENVRPISGWSGVEATRTGKNLLNINRANLVESNTSSNTTSREFTESQIWLGLSYNNYFIRGRIDTYINDGEQITVACNSTAYGVAFPCRCRPNTKYTISCKENSKCILCAGFYENDGHYISCASRRASSITITTPDKCEWLTICLCPEASDNNVTYSNLQFELSLTATDYEPYTGQTYPITFPSEAGTVYGGYVDVAKGMLTVDRAMVVFDGTQSVGSANWRANSNSVGWLYDLNITPGIIPFDSLQNSPNLMCDVFKTVSYNDIFNSTIDSISIVSNSNKWGIVMRSTNISLTTESAINEWLAQNPITVIYELAEPLTYSLTPAQLSTIKGLNNIYSNANGAIEMSYYSPVKENMIATRRSVVASAPHTETASGSVASFETNMAAKLKNLTVNIEPIQEGSGDPSPSNIRAISGWTGCDVVRSGSNILGGTPLMDNIDWAVIATVNATNKTISFTINAQKAYQSDVLCSFTKGLIFKPNTQYTLILSGTASNNVANIMFVYTDGTNSRTLGEFLKIGANVSASGKTLAGVSYRSYSGATVLNYDNCGLFEGVLTADEFIPYSGNTYSIDWTTEAGTVYGGTLDVTTGELTVTHIGQDFTGANSEGWTISGSGTYVGMAPLIKRETRPISSTYLMEKAPTSGNYVIRPIGNNTDFPTVAAWKSYLAQNPLQVCYQLDTPATYQCTPTEVQTLLGANNIYADTGNTNLTYWKH